MKHFFFVVAVLVAAGCNKPEESDCRRAVQRIRELTGTAHEEAKNEVEAAVRSCRGNATKESVQCAIEASSLEQLERCGLIDKTALDDLRAVDTPAASADAAPATPPPTPAADAAAAAPDAGAPSAQPPAPAGTAGGAAK